MDSRGRIDSVLARVDSGRSALTQVEEAGPPCSECSHYRPDRICNHLVFADIEYDTVSGTISAVAKMSAVEARQQDGLCGPEGLLFEPLPLPVRAIIAFHRTGWATPAYIVGGGAAAIYILSLFGLQ